MALLIMVFRKMQNTRWLMLSWFVGLLMTAALVSSIPIYTNGVLQQMLDKDLEAQQQQQQTYPGGLYDGITVNTSYPNLRSFDALNRYFFYDLPNSVRLPKLAQVTELDTVSLGIGAVGAHNRIDYTPYSSTSAAISSFTDFGAHIRLVGGRMPAARPVGGVYEVLVPVTAMANLNIALNQVYAVQSQSDPTSPILYIKPVGEFSQKGDYDPYWRTSLDSYDNTFVLSESLFRQLFVTGKRTWLGSAMFYTAYDYRYIHVSDIPRLNQIENVLARKNQQFLPGMQILTDFPVTNALSLYYDKAQQLELMMWTLNIPVLLTLAVYIFMVSRMIVDRDRTEIAVLRSRGASRGQIVLTYLLEVGILSTAAFLLGPIVGLGFTYILGESNGFLAFVQRVALPLQMSRAAYVYAFLDVLGCLAMILAAIIFTTGDTIVSHKQQMAREVGVAIWHKYFVDVLLLLVSWYGWVTIERGHNQLLKARIDIQSGLQIDPLSFFIPALFAVGCGLVCLRLYPWVIRFIHWIGRRAWPLSTYLALLQVGRAARQYQFMMVFLIMTIAVGIFSASAARTINSNLTQRIRYQDGADITLQEHWEFQQQAQSGLGQWIEPPYQPFTQLPDVIHAAQVQQQSAVTVKSVTGDFTSSTDMMAINPYDFAQTAWFRSSLLPYHWWGYCNLLAQVPSGALISQTLASRLNLQRGDTFTVHWDGVGTVQLTVEAVVNYWPTFNPLASADSTTGEPPTLVVANFSYIQQMMGLQPYQVWLKVKANGTAPVYQALGKQHIPLVSLTSADADITQLKHSPFLLGLNGTLTLGFLIAMAVSFIGFLLYWLTTLLARRSQLGVFRAMGLSFRRIIAMIALEQILTSGAACVLGGIIGVVTSKLYVSQYQLYFSVSDQVPPFEVTFNPVDGVRLYVFVLAMLAIGVGVIAWLMSRVRLDQAVKLGED